MARLLALRAVVVRLVPHDPVLPLSFSLNGVFGFDKWQVLFELAHRQHIDVFRGSSEVNFNSKSHVASYCKKTIISHVWALCHATPPGTWRSMCPRA